MNPDRTDRQRRVDELLAKGYPKADAIGTVRAEEAGYTPPPAHGVDKPGTIDTTGRGAKSDR